MESGRLVLLSTKHCSLCEQALDLLFSMPELGGHPLRVVDVVDDDTLLARYGERLPVLVVHGQELFWPFTTADVCRLLSESG